MQFMGDSRDAARADSADTPRRARRPGSSQLRATAALGLQKGSFRSRQRRSLLEIWPIRGFVGPYAERPQQEDRDEGEPKEFDRTDGDNESFVVGEALVDANCKRAGGEEPEDENSCTLEPALIWLIPLFALGCVLREKHVGDIAARTEVGKQRTLKRIDVVVRAAKGTHLAHPLN